ncbi:uncharacterized protein LOC111265476 isoform X2 [Varroa jacobsoni]|uniref:Uncharacterized protein n=1 Tax=Varroa destructor TaxID=109461 RepID=A0A7M7KKC3_VARDE|nr:uncharacterized protein LOC111252840 isoform X2 [Varroa destructor]XP_022697931.1 uncharacterized protein LOC111265476 isoform X2 [Varroa jacobsoni]
MEGKAKTCGAVPTHHQRRNISAIKLSSGKFVKRNFSMMFPWTFLEDDSDMLADLVLFYPRASPLSAPPHPPPPPPPGRFDCTVVLNGECETTPDLSSGLTTILLTAGQGRTPNLPLVTVGSALLFSIVCVTIFFTCRHHKRKMDFLAYKPGPQLSHVVLGPTAKRPNDGTLLGLSRSDPNESSLPDMYAGDGYGGTLPLQKAPLTPALVLLEAPRQGSKEHFNPIYEELDQHDENVQYSSMVERSHLEGNIMKPVAELRSRSYQFVTSRQPGSENIYASIEDQRFC